MGINLRIKIAISGILNYIFTIKIGGKGSN